MESYGLPRELCVCERERGPLRDPPDGLLIPLSAQLPKPFPVYFLDSKDDKI